MLIVRLGCEDLVVRTEIAEKRARESLVDYCLAAVAERSPSASVELVNRLKGRTTNIDQRIAFSRLSFVTVAIGASLAVRIVVFHGAADPSHSLCHFRSDYSVIRVHYPLRREIVNH